MTSPTTERRRGLLGSTGFKAPVTVLAIGNITQSGEQTIDGKAVLAVNADGVPDRVACVGMTDATKNGIWDVSTAAWTRSLDANQNYDLKKGTTVIVTDGDTYAGTYWQITASNPITLGTRLMTWARALASSISTLSFLQAGAGAVARGAQDKMRDIVSVKDFGAVGDGVTDDTVAMQAAHTTGKVIYYPAGTYLFSTITMAAGGIVGDASGIAASVTGGSILKTTSTNNANVITFTGTGTTAAPPVFRDFSLISTSLAKAGGYGIALAPANPVADRVHQAYFSNVLIRFIPGCIDASDADSFSIVNCSFYFYADKAVRVRNAQATDVGDSTIEGCHFFNSSGGAYAALGYGIWQESSGGLRVCNNKFNGGISAYTLDLKATTSILIFNGNSVENCSSTALNFINSVNTAIAPVRFNHVIISNNQFGQNARDIVFNEPANYAGVSYWDGVLITGNSSYYLAPADTASALNAVRQFLFGENIINGNSVGYRGLLVAASCDRGLIGRNKFNNLANSSLSNLSATTRIDGDVQTGTVTGVAINGAYGGVLFRALGAVVFTTPFESAPKVSAQTITSGEVVGTSIYGINAAGFNYQMVAGDNVTVGSFDWRAEGVLRSF